MASALMTSPSSSNASETARLDLPEPVGPTTAITGGGGGGVLSCGVPGAVPWGPGRGLTAADRQAWHAQRHAGAARGPGFASRPCRYAAGVGLRTVPGVTGTGAAQAVVPGGCGIGDQVESARLRDGDGHQIARPGHFGAGGHREVH